MKIFTAVLTSLIVVNSAPLHAETPNRFQACEVDLCGPDSKYARIRGQGAFTMIDQETRAILDNEVKPLLSQLAESSLQNKKAEYELAEEFLKKPNEKISASSRAFFTVSIYLSKIENQQNKVLTSKDGRNLQISAVRMQEAFPDLSSAQVLQMTAVLNAYFDSDIYRAFSAYRNLGYDLLTKSLGKDTKAFFSQTIGAANWVIQELGPAVGSRIDVAVLKKAESGQVLTAHEKLLVMNAVILTTRFSAMGTDNVKKLTEKVKLSFKDAAVLLNWDGKLSRMKSVFANSKMVEVQRQQAVEGCNLAIAGALAATPSALRQRKTNELLEQVKKATIETAPLYFSGQALANVIETVKKTQFSKPLNRTEARGLAMGSLNYYVAKALNFKAVLAAESKSKDLKYLSWRPLTESTVDENVFVSVVTVCEQMKPEFFPDAAAAWINQVRSGWQTNMFPEIGISILAHELGHIVSGSSGKLPQDKIGFEQVRSCAAEGHAKLAGSTLPSNFAQYAEEDWADAFSSRVVLTLEKNWPYFENSGCSMLHAEGSVPTLDLQDSSGVGTHSTSFLRTLQIQTQLGRPLPESCLQAMSSVEKEVVTRSCAK